MQIQSSRRSRRLSLFYGKQYAQMLYRDLKWSMHGRHLAPSDRYVFCRPIGGFNDNLAQISRCMIYCRLHNRKLVISMAYAGQLRGFTEYFTVHPSAAGSIILSETMHEVTGSRDIFPSGLRDDFENIYPAWDRKSNVHIDPETGIKIGFDDKDYPQSILFHAQCGGGPGWSALERFQFTPRAWQGIQERLSNLPSNYNAIHIRNSEYYRTDWRAFIDSIPKDTLHELPWLICTDDPCIVEAAAETYKSVKFHSIYQFPPDLEQGESLHYSPKARGWFFDIGMLSDLMGMARAQNLFIASHSANSFSGFSLLAQDLQRRPYLLNRLTSCGQSSPRQPLQPKVTLNPPSLMIPPR